MLRSIRCSRVTDAAISSFSEERGRYSYHRGFPCGARSACGERRRFARRPGIRSRTSRPRNSRHRTSRPRTRDRPRTRYNCRCSIRPPCCFDSRFLQRSAALANAIRNRGARDAGSSHQGDAEGTGEKGPPSS